MSWIERKVDGWHGNEPGTDDTTRGFVSHALRDITGRSFGKDPAAWRVWWDQSR